MLVSGAAGNFVAAVNAQSSNGFRAVVDIDLIGTFNTMRGHTPRRTLSEVGFLHELGRPDHLEHSPARSSTLFV